MEMVRVMRAMGCHTLVMSNAVGGMNPHWPPGEIVAAGLPHEDVQRVTRMVDRNEYKRRQAPPGVRITHRAFGRDRRYPITNHFREPL